MGKRSKRKKRAAIAAALKHMAQQNHTTTAGGVPSTPFGNGAYEKYPKKKNKKKQRGGIVCTCGAIEQYYTSLGYMHDVDCIINKGSATYYRRA